jgi:hypothetical protein
VTPKRAEPRRKPVAKKVPVARTVTPRTPSQIVEPPKPKATKRAVIACTSGLFVLGDAGDIESKWTPKRYAGQTGDHFVDFRGNGADELTTILRTAHDSEKLHDGTIRIHTRGLIETMTVKQSGERARDEHNWPHIVVSSAPVDMTLLHVEDATRDGGVGFVPGLGVLAARVSGNNAIQVTIVLGDDGEPDELRIKLR